MLLLKSATITLQKQKMRMNQSIVCVVVYTEERQGVALINEKSERIVTRDSIEKNTIRTYIYGCQVPTRFSSNFIKRTISRAKFFQKTECKTATNFGL